MGRVLVLATTTGYQTRSFGEAAERLGVELVFATDRCQMLDDPWQDGAIPIRFHDEAASADRIVEAVRARPIDGILVVGDRPTVIAASAAQTLGLPGHPPHAAAASRHKRLTRERLRAAGLPVPRFVSFRIDDPTVQSPPLALELPYPCVVKPVSLSGSRGVMRADDEPTLAQAMERLRVLIQSPEVRAERNEAHREILVEEFIPGHEYAIEAVMHHGRFHLLAIFDKPDPLDGPFFEETIYVTPPFASDVQQTIHHTVARAAEALGLWHGPIHAECRVNASGVYVLEVAARPIGGLCARAVGFRSPHRDRRVTLEEMLLRHALGESPEAWEREALASGVMMIPIPKRGILRGVDGIEAARAIPGVDDVRITAKMEQLLLPLPEGASYLGFIFARAGDPADVDRALRAAHDVLRFAIDPELQVVRGEARARSGPASERSDAQSRKPYVSEFPSL